MFKVQINYDYNNTPLSCGNMLESAFRRRKDIEVYRWGEIETNKCDFVLNTEAQFARPHDGQMTAWWDIEACSYRVMGEMSSDIVLAPYTYALEDYPDHAYFFPFASSPEFKYYPCDYEYDLMFIGREDINRNERVKLLDFLQSQPINFYRGNGFPRGEEVSRQLSKSKILLQRSGDAGGVMETRFFEIGPINVLAVDIHEGNRGDLEWAGVPDYHYIEYKNQYELLDKLRFYIKNDKARELMLKRARKNYELNHTYDVRVRQLLETIGFLKGKGLEKLYGKRKKWAEWAED